MRKYILLGLSILLFGACHDEQKDLDSELRMIASKAPKSVKPFQAVAFRAIINNGDKLRTVEFMLGDSTVQSYSHNGGKHVTYNFSYQPRYRELGTRLNFKLMASLDDGTQSTQSFSVDVKGAQFTLVRDTLSIHASNRRTRSYYINANSNSVSADSRAKNQLFKILHQGSSDSGRYPYLSFNFLNAKFQTYQPSKRPALSKINSAESLYNYLTQAPTDKSFNSLSFGLGYHANYVVVRHPRYYTTNFFKFSGPHKHYGFMKVLDTSSGTGNHSDATVTVVAFKESFN